MEAIMDSSLRRIDEVLGHYGCSRSRLALKMGVAQSTLNDIFRRGNRPRPLLYDMVCRAFPDVSREWLESGKGAMLRSEERTLDLSAVVASIETLTATVRAQQEAIERLTEEVRKLRAES